MSMDPVAYSPEVDTLLTPVDDTTDERIVAVGQAVDDLKSVIQGQLGTGPYVEQALRLADLVVQAAQQAARESPSEGSGTSSGPPEAPGTAQNETAAP